MPPQYGLHYIRRATKLVLTCKNLPYKQIQYKLGLPISVYRRERADMVQTYKLLYAINKTDKDKLFTVSQYRATRDH